MKPWMKYALSAIAGLLLLGPLGLVIAVGICWVVLNRNVNVTPKVRK